MIRFLRNTINHASLPHWRPIFPGGDDEGPPDGRRQHSKVFEGPRGTRSGNHGGVHQWLPMCYARHAGPRLDRADVERLERGTNVNLRTRYCSCNTCPLSYICASLEPFYIGSILLHAGIPSIPSICTSVATQEVLHGQPGRAPGCPCTTSLCLQWRPFVSLVRAIYVLYQAWCSRNCAERTCCTLCCMVC